MGCLLLFELCVGFLDLIVIDKFRCLVLPPGNLMFVLFLVSLLFAMFAEEIAVILLHLIEQDLLLDLLFLVVVDYLCTLKDRVLYQVALKLFLFLSCQLLVVLRLFLYLSGRQQLVPRLWLHRKQKVRDLLRYMSPLLYH